MRPFAVVALVVAVAALVGLGPADAARSESSTASCLRGRWFASTAESHRVLQALAPGPYRVQGQLFVTFDGRLMLYGTTQMRLSFDLGSSLLYADARFESQARYRVRRPGTVTLAVGSSVVTYEGFTAVKNGRRVTVPGPPDRSTSTPAGPWPYRCSAGRLTLKLPAFASMDWISFQRRR